MGAAFIYQITDLTKKFGQRELLKNINIAFYPGAKIGLLGRNGSGKSTLMKIMAGIDREYEGETRLADGYTAGYLEQEPKLDPTKSVFENVMEAVAPTRAILTRFEAINARLGEPMEPEEMEKLLSEQATVQDQIEARGAWDLDRRVEIAMDAMNLPPGDWEVTNLSGGERRRVALCKLLLERPDMLLLDEPTNHLDAESVNWLEKHLAEYAGTVVAVTHDRYFLDNVTGWILELDHGKGLPYEGNYTSWLEQKQKRMLQEEREDESRARTIERELEWIRQTPQARRTKSKARVAAFENLVAEAANKTPEAMQIVIPSLTRLGSTVIEADNLSKGYGDRLLIEKLNFRLPPGGIVGVIGPNGAGKTTLFRMIIGQDKPDEGSLKIGETVKLGYVDQSRDSLKADATVYQEISGGNDEIMLGKHPVNSRAYVGRFNFKGADQQKKVGQLSGGERNRVHLAKMLKEDHNVLLLDEPTNDLDVDTLRALELALLEFAGCAVVISHDRWFLDRIATHILAFEGDSHVEWFEGNFEDYEVDKKRRLGADAVEPHRIKYKPIGR